MKKFTLIFIMIISVIGFGSCAKQESQKLAAVMINDNLYYRMNIAILGVDDDWTPDGIIQSEVSPDQYPKEGEQSNFGTGYEYMIADGLYGIFVKIDNKIELYQLKDKGEFVYEDLVFDKADLTEEEFEWLSWYYQMSEEDRKTMEPMPRGLLDKGVPVEMYR